MDGEDKPKVIDVSTGEDITNMWNVSPFVVVGWVSEEHYNLKRDPKPQSSIGKALNKRFTESVTIMTKQYFAEDLVSSIIHLHEEGVPEHKIVAQIMPILDTLQPKDREVFSNWGRNDERSTPEQCWDL